MAKQIKLTDVKQVFTPGAPIAEREFFRGRTKQINRVIDALTSPGINPVIHGRRGVGKTSLANIIQFLVEEFIDHAMVVKVGCDTVDDFTSIWHKVFKRAEVTVATKAFGFSKDKSIKQLSLSQFVPPGDLSPGDVVSVLDSIPLPFICILDEFDRVSDSQARSAMADLIKSLSDEASSATIVIVGVGSTVTSLIGEHPSIIRNLKQIEMPEMDESEISEVIEKGFDKLGLKASKSVLARIIGLANGFPHYAHLLGLSCGRAAIQAGKSQIDDELFSIACANAVEDSIETLRDAFALATTTSKQSNYAKILIGCSFAECDDRGVFRATDVMNATNRIFKDDLNKPLTVPAVTPALGEFCSTGRGEVLKPVKVGTRNHYRFSDPLMKPFLQIKATELGKV